MMRELILIFTYIVCAFPPVLILKGKKSSPRLFWTSWLISLIGTFAGGVIGTMLLHRLGFEFGFAVGIIPAVIGAWLFTGLFLFIRGLPENW